MVKNNNKSLQILHDQEGKLVIWQKPNLPLTMWLGLTVASILVTNDQLKNFLEHLSMAFLFTWAYLELTEGVNYFRRVLGLVVLVASIVRFIQLVM